MIRSNTHYRVTLTNRNDKINYMTSTLNVTSLFVKLEYGYFESLEENTQ